MLLVQVRRSFLFFSLNCEIVADILAILHGKSTPDIISPVLDAQEKQCVPLQEHKIPENSSTKIIEQHAESLSELYLSGI